MRKMLVAVIVLVLAAVAAPARATVPSPTSQAGPYSCSGANGASFSVPFRFLEAGDLEVIVTTGTTPTTLVLTTDYTVANTGTVAGGTVTLPTGSRCPDGSTLTVKRTVDLTQTSSLRAQRQYSPATVENGLDKAMMGLQQLERELGGGRWAEQDARDDGQDALISLGANIHATDKAAQEARDAAQDELIGEGVGGGFGGPFAAVGADVLRSPEVRAADDVNARDFLNFSEAVTAANTSLSTLVVRDIIPITAYTIITAPLRIEGDGGFLLRTGGTLQILGPMSAPKKRLFHSSGSTVVPPTGITAAMSATGGTLRPILQTPNNEQVYRYRITATNAVGETLPSQEATMRVIMPPQVGSGPAPAGVTGTLLPNTAYDHAIATLGPWGESLSQPAEALKAATNAAGAKIIQVYFGAAYPIPAGITGFRLYRRLAGGSWSGQYLDIPLSVTPPAESWHTVTDAGGVTGTGKYPREYGGVDLGWAAVPGATAYNVYGRGAPFVQRMATGVTATAWTDDGTTTPGGYNLPTTDTTGGTPGALVFRAQVPAVHPEWWGENPSQPASICDPLSTEARAYLPACFGFQYDAVARKVSSNEAVSAPAVDSPMFTGVGDFLNATVASVTQTMREWISTLQARIVALEAAISVYPQTVVAPIFNPSVQGTYQPVAETLAVGLSSATAGASIYYTVDGSTPTTASTLYSAPFTINQTRTVKAFATKAGLTDSAVSTITYTLQPLPVAFSPAAGTYYATQTVTLSSPTPNVTIHYTTDGSTPTTGSPTYSAPITVSATQTIKALAAKTNWLTGTVQTATYTIAELVAEGGNYLGINMGFAVQDYWPDRIYADVQKTSRTFRVVSTNGNGTEIAVDANGWPLSDTSYYMFHAALESGVWNLRFKGRATVTTLHGAIPTTWDAGTNTSTGSINLTGLGTAFWINFKDTYRDGAAAINTGVTEIQFMRPGYAFPSGPHDPANFHEAAKPLFQKFQVVRYMDYNFTNHNHQVAWADRMKPNHASYQRVFQGEDLGGPWEHIIMMSNWLQRDAWINIPAMANDDYITKVAQMFKCGSDGVNPWVTGGACSAGTPTYPPLDPSLKLYVEWSNEVWNPGFGQWHDNERAVQSELIAAAGNIPENYDNVVITTAESSQQPWSAATTYAHYDRVTHLGFEWESISDGNIGHEPTGSSIDYWRVMAIYDIGFRRVARRSADVSVAFRTVFGDSQMMTRIRPILPAQQPNAQGTLSRSVQWALEYLGGWRGSHPTPHPVPYYFYGGGGSGYYNPKNDKFDMTVDQVFAGEFSGTMTPAGFGTADSKGWNVDLPKEPKYLAAVGLKRISYEAGPSLDFLSGEPQSSKDVKTAAVADPRMTTAIVNNHNAWSANGGDLMVYYRATGDAQWGFTTSIYDLATPKLQAIDQLNAANRAAVTLGRPLGASMTGASWDWKNYGSSTSAGFFSSTWEEWNASTYATWIVRADTASAGSEVVLTKTGTGTLQVLMDGIPMTSSDGLTWTGGALAPGLHGVVVRALTGTFTLNTITVNAASGAFTFSDDFTRSDGALGNGWLNGSPSEVFFANIVGNRAVRGNLNTSSSGTGNCPGTYSANQFIQARVSRITNESVTIGVRRSDVADSAFIKLNVTGDTNTSRLYANNAVVNQGTSWAGEYIRIEVSGQSVANGGTGVTARVLTGTSFATMVERWSGTHANLDASPQISGPPTFDVAGTGLAWLDDVTCGDL